MIYNKLLKRSLYKYIATGLGAFVIDYATLNTLYYYFSINLSIATTIGFFAGFIVSFVSNRKWVFDKSGSERHIARQIVEYISLVVFNYLFTLFVIRWLNNAGIQPAIGKLLIMGLITCWNYVIFKKIIFAPKKPSK